MGDISANFSRKEFSCRCGCGFDAVDTELIEALEGARQHFDATITITSGCRCAAHNARCGGAPKSQHVFAKAADFKVQGFAPAVVAAYLEKTYPEKYGIGRYNGWVHLDVRGNKSRWDKVGGES